MGQRKKITLTDLSNQLGVSIQTISKALRGRPGMSEQTRSRIIRAAYVHGYITVQQAREMVRQGIAPYPTFRLRFILVQSQQSMNHNRLLTSGLKERLDQFDHQLDILVLDEALSDEQFEGWLTSHNILEADGLLLAPRLVTSTMEDKLLSLPITKVMINYPKPLSNVDSVVWDVYEAICQSMHALIERGHRRILYVGNLTAQRGFIYRWQAYQEMMSSIGEPPLHCELNDLKKAYLHHRPTALLIGIDEEVAAAYDTLHDLGVDIPNDCSFVALLNEVHDTLPDISRPQLFIKETGYQAADRILWRIAHPHHPLEHTRIIGSFHIGNTIQSVTS